MQSSIKRVLLLGSGYMSESVADFILRRPENHVLIASDKLHEAKAVAEKFKRCEYTQLDVTNQKELLPLVEKSDIVISYVPAFLHPHVLKACLTAKKHMITASYVSPDMAAAHEEAKSKGLVFLNELGVDPGIDHMATMKIVDEVHEKGGKILEFYSYCGGLPSPQDCDNPLGYKFSWSPIGAVRAMTNSAKFLKSDKVVEIPNADLLFTVHDVKLNNALTLESLPNRDSVKYIDLYKMAGASSFFRGTLRYKGFCLIMRSAREIGLLREIPVSYLSSVTSWKQLIERLVAEQTPDEQGCFINQSDRKQIIESVGFAPDAAKTADKILVIAFSNKNYSKTSRETLMENATLLLNAFRWLGFFDENQKITPGKTYLEVYCSLLEQKLVFKKDEADAIFMQHIFKIDWGDKYEIRKSTLICIGEKGKRSAMALTVGFPTGIGAQLVLDGKITTPGVSIPIAKEQYEPILKILEENGIALKETSEYIYRPKL
eukprot:CAMPEP_0176447832 /NCGR_PEP_ID=MMETSP0127-20121128/25312_1 /TAXON_ID=938130 /ORGANISM="Platyophrya macrostoma, Strain WH" /LENGTH=488 /DNA_ID=CAMNT_0017834445 /DNA_START=26 /DNA_END=1492 /DNA_ORIENTATION=-